MGTGIMVLVCALSLAQPPNDFWRLPTRHLAIPIKINAARRAELQELELYVSTDQGRTWNLAGRATPDQQEFNFHAQSDGLYWFSVCSVDKAGGRDPADIAKAPPGQKVLIDTQTPALKIVSADRIGDDVQVTWETLDVQADPASLQLEYRAAESGPTAFWQRVPVSPALNGQTRFRPQFNGPITVRVQIKDSTGTPATVVKDLPAAPMAVTTANSGALNPALAPVLTAPSPPVPVPPPAAIQQANSITPPAASSVPLSQAPALTNTLPPPIPAAEMPPAIPAPPPQFTPPVVDPRTTFAVPPAPTPAETPAAPAPLAARTGGEPAVRPPVTAPMPDMANTPTPPSRSTPTDVQHVRDQQVAIEFAVERKGPSGIKRIQVYVTPDDGRSWFPYTETEQTVSPLQLTLPQEEGLYGFRLVLHSGADQSVGPPRSLDAPEVRLQVDRTKPKVNLYPPTIAQGQPNALVLHYGVSDAHLDPGTVKMYWNTQPSGQWQLISVSSPRTSSMDSRLKECTWTLPSDLPDRVYLRLTACDLAGNEGEFITRDPVTVDLHKPTAKVTGVIIGQIRK